MMTTFSLVYGFGLALIPLPLCVFGCIFLCFLRALPPFRTWSASLWGGIQLKGDEHN